MIGRQPLRPSGRLVAGLLWCAPQACNHIRYLHVGGAATVPSWQFRQQLWPKRLPKDQSHLSF